MRILATFLAVFIGLASPSYADDDKKKNAGPVPEPKVFFTNHRGRFNGEDVRYTATAGETYLKDENGKPTASIFSVTYTRDGVSDPTTRPVIFIFNGGPGSASLWLHMGVFGPKRVVLPSDATDDGAAPFRLEANPLSLIDVADMVMIDPVGTGYSKALGGTSGKKFWGIKKDAKSLAEFIRIWVTQNKRWNSPKYLSGESYGTTRAAALLENLEAGWTDISLNGIMFISSILDFSGAVFTPGNEIPYISYLPTYAATAWYHGKVDKQGRTLEGFLDEVREFSLNDYARALLQGDRLDPATRADIRTRLSAYSGLSEAYLDRTNLRIQAFRFMKELLRDEGKTVGRLDGRYTGVDYDTAGETPEADPSAYGIDGGYTAGVLDYMSRELNVDIERRYETLSGRVGGSWTWDIPNGWPQFVNVAPNVGKAQRQNSGFKVLLASGYYDMATPFFASENTFHNNGIDSSRVTFTYYEAGHMMYVHEPSLEKLVDDMRAFLAN